MRQWATFSTVKGNMTP